MSLTSHLAELERKHQALEHELHKAAMSPSISDLQIAELKRRKLALKDEIARLRESKPAAGTTLH
ncbi:YdcH family protein [Salinarimonas sp.]|uniref:YdcH family protein n=1 Tax=Salinarimonas sp. TaxID=2766526 RepID=UPI00391C2EA8